MATMPISAPDAGCEPSLYIFEGQNVRVIVQNDEPWFVAKDIANLLGYANPQEAIRTHCKGVSDFRTPSSGGSQLTKIIPERDVYRLIMRSKLPAAEQFEEWVVGEVLPAIRKTGSYGAPAPAPSRLEQRFERVLTLAEKLAEALAIATASRPSAPAPAPTRPPRKNKARRSSEGEVYLRTKDVVREVTSGQKIGHAHIVSVGRSIGKFCQENGYECLLFQNRRIYPRSAVDAWLDQGGREMILALPVEKANA